MNKVKNHLHNSSKVAREEKEQLRIGEYNEAKIAKEVFAITKINKNPSRP